MIKKSVELIVFFSAIALIVFWFLDIRNLFYYISITINIAYLLTQGVYWIYKKIQK